MVINHISHSKYLLKKDINMSKGSTPRPIKDRKKFDEEYDRLFPKKDKK